jgi:hypothetical protein
MLTCQAHSRSSLVAGFTTAATLVGVVVVGPRCRDDLCARVYRSDVVSAAQSAGTLLNNTSGAYVAAAYVGTAWQALATATKGLVIYPKGFNDTSLGTPSVVSGDWITPTR